MLIKAFVENPDEIKILDKIKEVVYAVDLYPIMKQLGVKTLKDVLTKWKSIPELKKIVFLFGK
jgi:hypothetical protein